MPRIEVRGVRSSWLTGMNHPSMLVGSLRHVDVTLMTREHLLVHRERTFHRGNILTGHRYA
jgi:hypothetical protein